jgi:hypothetical protein
MEKWEVIPRWRKELCTRPILEMITVTCKFLFCCLIANLHEVSSCSGQDLKFFLSTLQDLSLI